MEPQAARTVPRRADPRALLLHLPVPAGAATKIAYVAAKGPEGLKDAQELESAIAEAMREADWRTPMMWG